MKKKSSITLKLFLMLTLCLILCVPSLSYAKTSVTVTSIKDITGMPHNGCRARKRRRV